MFFSALMLCNLNSVYPMFSNRICIINSYLLFQALEHISKLAEELKAPIPISERKKKTLAPSVFRR